MVETIRKRLIDLEDKIYNDPETSDDTKEFYEYSKRLFSNYRFLRSSGASTIMSVIYFTDKSISDEDLVDAYKQVKAQVSRKNILVDGENK